MQTPRRVFLYLTGRKTAIEKRCAALKQMPAARGVIKDTVSKIGKRRADDLDYALISVNKRWRRSDIKYSARALTARIVERRMHSC